MAKEKTAILAQGSKKEKEPCLILGEKQVMEAKLPINMNRKYQDSFFTSLFKIPKYRRAAYLLMHPEDADVEDSEFENIELENVFTVDMYNDVCFMVRGRLIILMEHQSTLNYNMPVRVLLYVVEEYKKLLSMKKYKRVLYGSRQIQLPKPEFYMVYTGKEECPDSLKLSDAFEGKASDSFLELKVTVYKEDNVKGVIHEFISLIQLVKKAVAEGKSMEEAVREAIRQYQEGFEISDYFAQRKDVFQLLGEAITWEEFLDLRDEANASVLREELRGEIREEVTKELTEQVTKQVTKEVTKQVTKEVTKQVTKQVTKEVTKQVTKEVTKQVTEQVVMENICKAYKILTSVGANQTAAIQAIMKEYDMPEDRVLAILQKS